ncbi:MAG: glutamate--cysteine ligase [Polyangia bacterium]
MNAPARKSPAPAPHETLTLGIEEEFHLIDLATRRSTPRAGEVLPRLAAGGFAAELQQTTVETNTPVVRTLDDLRRSLVALRAELIRACEPLGIGVVAAGTMPLPVPITITENARFQRMLADYQVLVREQLICGLQVHVGIGDPDVAAVLIERVARWLPPLLALSASSPFSHDGQDTGYASARTLIWSRWPTTGCAGEFASAAEYDRLVQDLIGSGVISDRGMIYFDVRPSSHAPTLELRVCDACPSVDTAVLIAGLFRAVVMRERARFTRGEPSLTPSAAILRAAMWRAARSALEGELVDLSGPHPVPAGVLLRKMVDDLRPELEADASWQAVSELCEAALAQGSSAARQREALRRHARIADVVDLLVAETAGRAPAGAPAQTAVLPGYHPGEYDEAVRPDGQPRPSHATVLEMLASLPARTLHAQMASLEQAKEPMGLVFRATGQAAPASFQVDLVPRVVSAEDWSRLQGGTAQRTRALEAFLSDIYGERQIVRDGVLPAWVASDAPGFRAAGEAVPRRQRRIQVAGFDVVRDRDGRWLVLEDNVRVPSGVAYAVACRRLLRSACPELFGAVDLHDPEEAPRLLRAALAESAPAGAPATPQLCLLTSGPDDSAYFEHRWLAAAMDIPLVTAADLLADGDAVWLVSDGQRRALDVVYLRMDDRLARTRGADGQPLGPGLLAAVRAGRVALANALGNGVADDKATYAFVPALIDYYLGERPLLDQVRTYHCADPEQRREVMSRLDQLVVKPVDGYGGLGVVIGPHATDHELASVRALIHQQPARWVAQETVALSTHPTFAPGAGKATFEARHVDLRVFVYQGAAPVVVPAPLTRMAPARSMVVNSSRGGGAKDTWIMR